MKKYFMNLMVLTGLILAAGTASGYSELHMMDSMQLKKQPDIVADTVTRTSLKGSIPVLLLLRHTDKYPTILKRVTITAGLGGAAEGAEIVLVTDYNLKLKQPLWYEVKNLEIPDDYSGEVFVNVDFDIKTRTEEKTIRNNNQRKSQHEPLRILVGAPPLPAFDGWHYGDAHFHTIFSDNQAEFGAPVDVSAQMADVFGLDWQVFTDHSFDLDDEEGNSEANDAGLPRWKRYKEEISGLEEKHPGLVFMVGEELSCGNSQGQNVHMLVYNMKNLYIGNGDGFEGINTPDSPCAEITSKMPATEAAHAAHPIVQLLSVELYVINRGNWSMEDISAPGLTGLQAWNHTWSPLPEGFAVWRQLLLEGEKKFLLGGTDAHGDFNRETAGWPDGHPFGGIRTAVNVEGALTREKLLDALRFGRTTVTSGPVAVVEIVNEKMERAGPGGEIYGSSLMAEARVRSTEEFGPVEEIRVLAGDTEKKEEVVIAKYYGELAADPRDMDETVILPGHIRKGYVRVEATSKSDGLTYEAYTNPVWFELK